MPRKSDFKLGNILSVGAPWEGAALVPARKCGSTRQRLLPHSVPHQHVGSPRKPYPPQSWGSTRKIPGRLSHQCAAAALNDVCSNMTAVPEGGAPRRAPEFWEVMQKRRLTKMGADALGVPLWGHKTISFLHFPRGSSLRVCFG